MKPRILLRRAFVAGGLTLAGCTFVGPHASRPVPELPPPAGFVVMPVQYYDIGRKLAFGSYRTVRMRTGLPLGGTLGLPLGPISLFNRAAYRQKLRFTMRDGAGCQAEVQALNRIKLYSDITKAGLRPVVGFDSVSWLHRRNIDEYTATIQVSGPAANSVTWRFTVQNAHRLLPRPVRGQVTDGTHIIHFKSTDWREEYLRAGSMPDALLASRIKQGVVFSYEDRPVGALSMGVEQRPEVWLRPDLDPNLQFAIANSAVLLLKRRNLTVSNSAVFPPF